MRKSIALACILKNELQNLPQLINSVEGCFDEIHLTDTGSTDGSIEWIEKQNGIKLHHFKWVDDFAAARNASFEPVKTDYVMWMDLDDELSNKEKFKCFRDNIMPIFDAWIATYNYSFDKEGKPNCSFARERVFSTKISPRWRYFVHEGIVPAAGSTIGYATSWTVDHKRTEEDIKKDRSRNLNLLKNKQSELDARMRYYYGKELFENQNALDAFPQLIAAIADEKLESHDRVMGIQYACLCAMQLGQFERAIQLAHQGLQLTPQRAEFHSMIGDSYLKLGKLSDAIPFFRAASHCQFQEGELIKGAIFSHAPAYNHHPLNQIARIKANLFDLDGAEVVAKEAQLRGTDRETEGILKEIKDLKEKVGVTINVPKTKTEDFVITATPVGPYEWDDEIYRAKGIGGSETAAVEMAHHIARLSKRRVLVFNNRTTPRETQDGVHYLPAQEASTYFSKNLPKANVNWRHATKFTDAPTVLWCHDLSAPGMENQGNYDYVFALSNFHKNFLVNLLNINPDKVIITSNGIDPNRFKREIEKDDARLIFSSSPDRGLIRAIRVANRVARHIPEARLHCYYGFDNMLKLGLSKQVEEIQKEISKSECVTYHGNISQTELTKQFAASEVWLYPTNFLETYCITAIESLCSRTYPVVRAWGGLNDTLEKANKAQMASVLDLDCVTPGEEEQYAHEVIKAIEEKKWKRVDVRPEDYSWEKVAHQWIEFLDL